MQLDLSKVPNLEARKEEERLFLAEAAAVEAYDTARDAKIEALDQDPELAALAAVRDTASKAYQESGLPRLDTDHYDEDVLHCALSGLPLLEDDEVISDEETGEKILRCLVLPPRPVEEEETEEEEAA